MSKSAESSTLSPTFDPFLLNPANHGFLMGQIKHPRVERWKYEEAALGLLLVIFSLLIFFVWSGSTFDFIHLGQNGATASATVVDREPGGGEISPKLIYQFKLTESDTLYGNAQEVDDNFYSAYSIGSTVTVIYWIADPNTSQLLDRFDYEWTGLRNRWGFGIFLFIVGLSFYIDGTLRPVFINRLLRSGQIIEGTVINTKYATFDPDEDPRLRVRYSFQSPSGETLTGYGHAWKRGKQDHCETGRSVAVVYRNRFLYRPL